MTNEELITGLKHIAHTMERNGHSYYQHVAEGAIKALEQQPSEDCISREAVLDGLANIAKAKAKSDAQKALMGRVMFFTEQLPSVKPKYTDEEIDKAQAVEQAYVDKMVELAVEETKRPKGKWIRITNGAMREKYICSECGRQIEEDGIEEFIAIKYPYCHCGAEMSRGEAE